VGLNHVENLILVDLVMPSIVELEPQHLILPKYVALSHALYQGRYVMPQEIVYAPLVKRK
jgi:hypothetical protein